MFCTYSPFILINELEFAFIVDVPWYKNIISYISWLPKPELGYIENNLRSAPWALNGQPKPTKAYVMRKNVRLVKLLIIL